MDNILQWIIDLPFIVFPVMENIFQMLTTPLNDTLLVFIEFMQGLSLPLIQPLMILSEALLVILTALGTNITLFDLIIGGLLPMIIIITLIKWIIGIVT